MKFVKLNNNNQFVAVAPSICPNFATGMYMQDFTSQMCANAPTPSGTDYFPIGVLTDRRDNKTYEVRKFADGNCWMVDNLAYGFSDLNNGIDGCLKTTFCGVGYQANGSCIPLNGVPVSIVDKIAPGVYGDCRYPYGNITDDDINKYGYLYNWQAVIQDASAYSAIAYQLPEPTQGICPDGWYLPTGGPNGQFRALYAAAGSPIAASFWEVATGWHGVLAGSAMPDNSRLYRQGESGYYWSSTPAKAECGICAYDLVYGSAVIGSSPTVDSSGINAIHFDATTYPESVRCLKTP